MMKKKLQLAVLSAILLLFVSCVSRPQFTPENEEFLYPFSTYIPENFDWQEVCPGIFRFDYKNQEFPIIYHAVKIDLSQPGLELLTFPDASLQELSAYVEGDEVSLAQPLTYRSIATSKFAAINKCAVAINLSPFSGKNGSWNLSAKLGSLRQLVGLHVADGLIISEPVSRYAAISFVKKTKDDGSTYWQANIERNQSQKTAESCDFAFGGFYIVLEDGQIQDFKSRSHDSRSGAGLSEDGKTLYLLVVEGENPFKSQGLSYPQCAQLFKAMGCSDALELDGGGSSELCINGRSVLSYTNFRVQANSLGFNVDF